jgi:hypothetical protein
LREGAVPTYKAAISVLDTQLVGDREFSINCHVNAATTLNAWERALEIAEAAAGTIWTTTMKATKVYISNPDVVNGSLSKLVDDVVGTRVPTGSTLPGWNVVRVQFAVAEGIRPHTFYLRMGLTEGDVVGQTLEVPTGDAVQAFIDAFLLTGANCDKDGAAFVVGTYSNFVAMRQMGWKRRTKPGFKRGWVPA